MFLTALISLILHSGSDSFPTEDRQAATGSRYVCPGSGYSEEMALSDFSPAPASGTAMRLSVNAQLMSGQRGKLGIKLDTLCCPGRVALEVPWAGWHATPHRGAHVFDVTITQVICN